MGLKSIKKFGARPKIKIGETYRVSIYGKWKYDGAVGSLHDKFSRQTKDGLNQILVPLESDIKMTSKGTLVPANLLFVYDFQGGKS